MTSQKKLALAVKTAILGLSGVAMMPNLVFAQDASDSADEKPLEEVRVTGSRLPRVDMETANPLISITADDILNIGAASTQDVLAALPQNTGSLDQQQVFGFTAAASGVDLRGAGVGRSLTLIDGKRTPKYPVAANGTDNFSDTSNIPLGAIERIEILTTGASAIYGSDAMGGVINIILKDDYEGVEFKAKHGDTSHGGRETNLFSITGGTSSEKSALMFFVEHETKESLTASERNNFSELGNDYAYDLGSYSSYGIALRNAANNRIAKFLNAEECAARGMQPLLNGDGEATNCGFNRATRRDLYPEMDRTSALINFRYDVGPGEFYSRVNYTHGETFRNIEPMPVADYTYYVGITDDLVAQPDPGYVTLVTDATGSKARFEQSVAFGGDFADLEDGVYYPTRRMVEFGNRRTGTRTDNFSILSGLEGDYKDWHWDVDWMFARTAFYDWSPGFASADLYFNYLSSGENGRSIFDEMTQEEVDQVSYIPWSDAQSNITGFSGSIDGLAFDLPAGPVSIAAGFESYREWFYNTSDTESTKGNILSTGGSSGEGGRDYRAIYTETLIPVVTDVNLSVALRYDDYSDFGSNLASQFAVEYRPIDSLLLRALWAETFRAPDLQRVYGDPTAAFSQIYDPYSCEQQGGVLGDDDSEIAACNGELYVDQFVGPNSELEAETGTNVNFGVVYNKGNFDMSFDYWELDIENLVNDLTAQQIATDYEIYGELITRGANDEITVVNATAQNLSFRTTKGIDFSFGYKKSLNEAGNLNFKLAGTYLTGYDEQFSATTPVEDQLEVDRIPDLRAQFSVGYDLNDFSTTMFFNYTGEMNGTNNEEFGPEAGLKETIDSQILVNWSASYAYKGATLRAGINNLMDEEPPVDETDVGWPFYPQEYYNALGRNFYVSVSYAID